MSFDESRKLDQLARARQIAYELAGSRYSRGIVRAVLALVEADEKPGDLPEPEPLKQVAAGARQVLQKVPVQEGLW